MMLYSHSASPDPSTSAQWTKGSLVYCKSWFQMQLSWPGRKWFLEQPAACYKGKILGLHPASEALCWGPKSCTHRSSFLLPVAQEKKASWCPSLFLHLLPFSSIPSTLVTCPLAGPAIHDCSLCRFALKSSPSIKTCSLPVGSQANSFQIQFPWRCVVQVLAPPRLSFCF